MNIFSNIFSPNIKNMASKRNYIGLIKVAEKAAVIENKERFNAALEAIAEIGEPKAIPLLFELWNKKIDYSYRTAINSAVEATAKTFVADKQSRKEVNELFKIANDYVGRIGAVAVAAIDAIGQIGDSQTIPLLERLIDNTNDPFNRSVKNAIKSIGARVATAEPRVLSDQELARIWTENQKCLMGVDFEGKQQYLPNLREGYSKGVIKGEKCDYCFHPSVIQVRGSWLIWIGQQIDMELPVSSLCLYCGQHH